MRWLRRFLDKIIGCVARNPIGWAILRTTVVRPGLVVQKHRLHFETKTRAVDIVAATRQLSPEGRVLHGPFAGMRYSQMESHGSTLFPKLLGSYEREIHPWIYAGDARHYKAVVDIGCAEGYYAVGMALRWPQAVVHAFDIEARARGLCADMARLNSVESRVNIHSLCSQDSLRALNLPVPSLIVSDCEGFESELLSEQLIAELHQHDFLIELHDFFDITISTTLKARFSNTHNVESVYSVDDIQKAHSYEYPELARWDLHDRRTLISEVRPYVMEWIYCRSRSTG